jgi:SNW domain-containing protein 1
MVDMPKDFLEPPKFKHKRIPKAFRSAPIPLMHSPPRPLTMQDQLDWKVPPCISNWKNSKGYTIPLDKRLAADGRVVEDVHVNERFAVLSEAMYVVEQGAREGVEMRSKIQREIKLKEGEKRNEMLREFARIERRALEGHVGKKTKFSEASTGLEVETDPFGLDQFLTEVNKGKKKI